MTHRAWMGPLVWNLARGGVTVVTLRAGSYHLRVDLAISGATERFQQHKEGEMDSQCLGLDEAAKRLAVQPSTLRRWARDGKLESVRLGRRLVFRETALEAFVRAAVRTPQGVATGRQRV